MSARKLQNLERNNQEVTEFAIAENLCNFVTKRFRIQIKRSFRIQMFEFRKFAWRLMSGNAFLSVLLIFVFPITATVWCGCKFKETAN